MRTGTFAVLGRCFSLFSLFLLAVLARCFSLLFSRLDCQKPRNSVAFAGQAVVFSVEEQRKQRRLAAAPVLS
jgi:hypothetical protein